MFQFDTRGDPIPTANQVACGVVRCDSYQGMPSGHAAGAAL